jgi:uncharacterized protein YnzC (UPF0291/DUF896 family)
MYIKKEDYRYFMGLFKSLDEAVREKFVKQIRKAGKEKVGTDISKIKVIDDSIYDVQAVDPTEIITRTMIKKAYKAICNPKKEGK